MVEKKTAPAAQGAPKAAASAAKTARSAAKSAPKPLTAAKPATVAKRSTLTMPRKTIGTVETTVQSMVQVGAEAAKEYEKAVEAAQAQVQETSNALFEGYEDFAATGKANIDACVRCGTIMAKGFETLGNEVMKYAQASLDANLAVTQSLIAAKTLREALDLQTDYTRGSIDSLVSEAAKLTEISVDLAGELMTPIQARFSATTENLLKPLAR